MHFTGAGGWRRLEAGERLQRGHIQEERHDQQPERHRAENLRVAVEQLVGALALAPHIDEVEIAEDAKDDDWRR